MSALKIDIPDKTSVSHIIKVYNSSFVMISIPTCSMTLKWHASMNCLLKCVTTSSDDKLFKMVNIDFRASNSHPQNHKNKHTRTQNLTTNKITNKNTTIDDRRIIIQNNVFDL